jgi:hypothetical protein
MVKWLKVKALSSNPSTTKKKKKGVYDEALKYTNPKLTEPTREKGKSSRL